LILAVVLYLFDTMALNAAIALISIMAMNEMMEAAGYTRNWPLRMTAYGFSALIPFLGTAFIWNTLPAICFGFALLLFLIFLIRHDTTNIEEIGFTFLMSLLITFSLSSAIYMRDRSAAEGMFYVLVALTASWMSDTGAFFAGHLFGRRKLAPAISPKKTVEGAVGGILVAAVSLWALGAAYTAYCIQMGLKVQINDTILLACAPFLSAAGVMGDLSASAIKRQFKIKDFGNIMPGHGGVIDRFDSVLFVMPLVYIISQYFPLILVL
jgi:phosphatidate cytidylyltransferase